MLQGKSKDCYEQRTDAVEDDTEFNYTVDSKVWNVIDDPAFKGYGRLIFPADKTIDKSMTLSEVGSILTWYNYVNPDRTVEIVNYLKTKGFSMGSVTTWYTFVNCLDEFRYFLPMSGAMDYEGDDVDAAVTASGHSPDDFFIYAITGTDDFEGGHFTRQIEGMLGMPSGNFISADSEESGNIAFRIKDGYSHDGRAAMEYTYNGLMWFGN